MNLSIIFFITYKVLFSSNIANVFLFRFIFGSSVEVSDEWQWILSIGTNSAVPRELGYVCLLVNGFYPLLQVRSFRRNFIV